MSKPKARKPNLYLNDTTKRHVMSKTYYAYRTYDQAIQALAKGSWSKDRKIALMEKKNQALQDALTSVLEALDCCQGCRDD